MEKQNVNYNINNNGDCIGFNINMDIRMSYCK